MSGPATAVADATVIVVIAAAVDASRSHDSHDNATVTNYYDSNEETSMESMSTYSDEYQLYHYANYKCDAANIKYVMHIIELLYEQISN